MVALMQHGHASADHYLGLGDLKSEVDDQQQVKTHGDPDRQLTLRQAPLHARVALGKEKDRKPIDPPPIVQLIDKRTGGRSSLYDSPYLFMSSSLVPENYDEQTMRPELPSTYLTGSLASSIHRLRDTTNSEGGFFVFGDLSVKQEGRFRLRFTLYERDDSSIPSFRFVSELITNIFTVYSAKNFPGMTESTYLTRTFSDQGVKLRLRKDSRTINTRKRSRPGADSTEALLGRQPKRLSYERTTSFGGYDSVGLDQMGAVGESSGLGPAQQPYTTTGPAMTSVNHGSILPLPTSGYYLQNFTPPSYY
ncbi:velvet factor-domain-containing protein [Stachybotrys elegans]|uniref:Velvet factor-domain-containing protein n=1 Tax=Stachybotrys elegans TaxID=80388 RepID=A0A8K0WN60_9HYPO|nr:velvet factor-domain-containing protein [Stachybotrys elegans]